MDFAQFIAVVSITSLVLAFWTCFLGIITLDNKRAQTILEIAYWIFTGTALTSLVVMILMIFTT